MIKDSTCLVRCHRYEPVMMRGWHAPWGDENPYQRLLAGALSGHGVQVRPLPASVWLVRAMSGAVAGDVLHLHWMESLHMRKGRVDSVLKTLVFLSQLWRLKRRGVRLVWTMHNAEPHEVAMPRLQAWAQRRVARWCDSVIVHCGYARRLAVERYGLNRRRVVVVPHGHYKGVYPPGKSRQNIRAALGVPHDAFVFLFLGSLRWYKGLGELIEAFAGVKGEDVRLVVAGKARDPLEEAKLRSAAAADRRVVCQLGFVPDEAVAGFLGGADMMVLPFRKVLTSGSMILAMSYGLPVLTRPTGCLPETAAGWGVRFFDGEDSVTLTEAMQHAAGEAEVVRDEGRRAKERSGRWSWERVGRRTARAYGMAI